MQPLATIEEITEIYPHPNADKLELAKCCNYQCIVPIDTYEIGDYVLFIHPDTVLPKDRKWAETFLKFSKNRVKAQRFRGEWSFGIIAGHPMSICELKEENIGLGQEVSELIGVKKYELKYPNHQKNKLNPRRPHLPYNLPKTDEERWQSIPKSKIRNWFNTKKKVDVTLKIDGQSWTAYYKDGDFGITSRGTDYKIDADERNNFTRHLDKYPIEEKLTKYCVDNKVNLAIRGESYGTGIQSFKHNPHASLEPGLALFSVFNLDTLTYERRESPLYVFRLANLLRLPVVPILEDDVELNMDLIQKYENMSDYNGKPFEGVVINGIDFSFKVINLNYDAKK